MLMYNMLMKPTINMKPTVVFQISFCSQALYFLFASLISSCQSVDVGTVPLGQSSFLSIWNAPTELCMKKHKVNVDLRFFQIVSSTLKSTSDQELTLFYSDRLGYYPFMDEFTGKSHNGGIPQMTDMNQHLKKAREDILYYIPSATQPGLAVIDWEYWRPSWIRNWASKDIYRKQSIELVQQKDLTLTENQARSLARAQFEYAAKNLILKTLKLCKSLRPQRLWGLYLFPNCQNFDYKVNPQNYTGRCPDVEIERNDKLQWLWKESTALYPNIYLDTALKYSQNAALFSRNRIQEAIRLSTLSNKISSMPIYVYTRPVFTDRYEEYLSKNDLIGTIGETAALGVSGFVMWGDLNFTLSTKTCNTLNTYLKNILNPYVINVTLAAKLCSTVLCQNNGVCARKQWNSNDYLHLNEKNMVIQLKDGKYTVTGQPTIQDLNQFLEKFTCRCYEGRNCILPSDLQNIGLVNVCISQNICINAVFNMTSNIVPKPSSKLNSAVTSRANPISSSKTSNGLQMIKPN
ncbi:hyaluronidase PH-20 [Ascaphus truei]|uniref:hyaluronidase PH-20 n=1 Tax=Ascaphus truei TaxID=8439 RepID=UPI003F5AC42B